MNQAHLHLLLNHLPMMGAVIGFTVLLVGVLSGNDTVRRTAYGILLGASVAVIPTHITGEGAEEVLEQLPNVNHRIIHAHEEAVGLFQWAMAMVGLLASLSLFSPLRQYSWLKWVLILATIVALYGGQKAGTTGGEISHPEIRTSASE
jgi:uncharacterized membrane protein